MEKTLINIDSRLRDYTIYPYASFFKLGFDNQTNNNINFLNYKNIDTIMVSSAEIPNNFNVFASSRFNISFVVTCSLKQSQPTRPINNNNDDCCCDPPEPPIGTIVPNTVTITITDGNYSIDELVNAINTQFISNQLSIGKVVISDGLIISFDTGSNVGNSKIAMAEIYDGLVLTYDKNTNKITLKNLSINYEYAIDFNNNSQNYISLGYMLGYRLYTYFLNIATYIDNNNPILIPIEQMATHNPDVDGEKYLFLRINDYGNIIVNHTNPYKVFCKIVLDRNARQFVYNNGGDYIYKAYKFRQPTDINKLEIELLDYTGNRIQNYGSDFSLTIELTQIYDENKYVALLNSLKVTNKPIDNLSSIAYLDNNNYVVETEKKTTQEILSKVFDNVNKLEIIQSAEIKNLEDKRVKKVKKKKFGFKYVEEK